jgi:hypothetical protein
VVAVTSRTTPFATFALLYMTALFLELAEKWTYPLFTLATLVLIVLILWFRITRISFLIFLAVTSAHFVLVQFPDVANHVNVAIYCNFALMLGVIYSLVRIHDYPTDDDYFAMMRPLLQATAILVYFLAGFHKLNADFVNPDVSCVGDLLGDLSAMARSEVAGIPTALILAVGILAVAYRLLSSGPIRQYLLVVAGVGAIGLTSVSALLALGADPAIPPVAKTSVILGLAFVVIAWELIGGPLLAVRRLQAPLLAFSWTMHATLALIGFVDFGALALSLLFTFVPPSYLNLLDSRLRVPVLKLCVHRAVLYFAINVAAGILSGLHRRLAAGILFNLAALVFIWPLLSAVRAPAPRGAWAGVRLSRGITPKWMFIFPVLLLLHGITSYVGLRTAGNFSMFSNLRTEGARSNHFLLRSNPLKLWSYQEDVVRFIDIDDRRAKIGYQYQPLQGNQLPIVEFRKLIYAWTKAGSTIPMAFEHRGNIYVTEDIVHDPAWRTDARDWEMVLMDFRVIQPDGPNRCRW